MIPISGIKYIYLLLGPLLESALVAMRHNRASVWTKYAAIETK